MGYFIQALKISVIVIVLILIGATYYKVNAYTYESDVDPKQFFNYEVVEAEQIGGLRTILSLRGDVYPRYVVVLISQTQARQVVILAYCYFKPNGTFVNYALDVKTGVYVETPAGKSEKMLRMKLIRIYNTEADNATHKGGNCVYI